MTLAATLLSLLTVPSLRAQTEAIHKMIEPKPNVAAASLSSYLERVERRIPNPGCSRSIWIDNGRLARMTTDVRAYATPRSDFGVVSESLQPRLMGTVKKLASLQCEFCNLRPDRYFAHR